MSSRALKKLYRDDLSATPSVSPDPVRVDEEEEEEAEEEDEEEVVVVKKSNPFALLNDEEESEEDEEEREEKEELPVKKANPFELLNDENEEDDEEEVENGNDEQHLSKETTTIPTPSSKKKKNKKKNKKKKNSNINTASTDNSIDSLISQLESTSSLLSSKPPSYLKFLQLDAKDLDYEYEFRKLFGKQALKDNQNKASNNDLRNTIRNYSTASSHLLSSWGGRDGRSFPGSSRKLVLAKIKEHYIPTIKRDIRLEQLTNEEDEANNIMNFKFTHSPEYKEAQLVFEHLRPLGDVQAMINQVMLKTPYHIPTLLVLADNRSQTGNHSESSDFLEQGLLTFDRGLKSNFSFCTGQCRLPFKYFENRSFYLIIFEYIKSLMRRGTWQTAFTYTKLLLSLQPEDDPYGAALMIDFFALKSGNYQYIIDIADEPYFNQPGTAYYTRPNFYYSKALAHFIKTKGNDINTSNKYLQFAISRFPWVIADLMGYHTSEETVYNYDGVFPSTTLNNCDSNLLTVGSEQAIYSSLYNSQMKSFWEPPEIRNWIKINLQSPTLKLEPIKQSFGVSLNLVRYVMVSQQTQTFKYIPPEMLSQEIWADDPFPPIDNISPYS